MKAGGRPAHRNEIDVDVRIIRLREQLVLLDSSLADLYGVSVRNLSQAVKRHAERFPDDFMFQLSWEEATTVRPPDLGRGHHRKYRPYAFTELGAGMLGSLFRGPRTARLAVDVIRAFARMRAAEVGPTETDFEANGVLGAVWDALRQRRSDRGFTTEEPITYFIQAGLDGPIKIGSTRNLPSRFRSLQLMSPIPLVLLGVSDRNIERHCHYILGPWRIHGEWFLPEPRVLDVISDVATVKNAKLR